MLFLKNLKKHRKEIHQYIEPAPVIHPEEIMATIPEIPIQPESIDALFARKVQQNEIVELSEWAQLSLDSFIASFKTLDIDKKFAYLAQELHMEDKVSLSFREMWNIYNWVLKTQDIPGDIAELGVYSGGSAKLICEVKGNRSLHLFDTFTGIPTVDASIDEITVGAVAGDNLEAIQVLLSKYPDVHFYEGIFPDTTRHIPEHVNCYSFIHLDFDVYPGTLSGLEYFYPRLSKGGIMITHDYRTLHCLGVKKAFDEFFADKPETVIELWDSQAMIVKL